MSMAFISGSVIFADETLMGPIGGGKLRTDESWQSCGIRGMPGGGGPESNSNARIQGLWLGLFERGFLVCKLLWAMPEADSRLAAGTGSGVREAVSVAVSIGTKEAFVSFIAFRKVSGKVDTDPFT
jgi:hypothetical protein